MSGPIQNRRVLSGMRPTGQLHLGNYHGALKNWIELQYQYECYFFVADWHALTTGYEDTSKLEENTWSMVIDWLAAGLNPGVATLFIQSKVPEHAELHLLLSMITPLGWLERVPSYKDQQAQLADRDLATYGFLGYPLLQSADILLYRSQFVPVGEDQVAHVEITREVARRFNHIYGREPEFEEKVEKAIKSLGSRNSALYRALRRINPAPFLFFLDFGGFAVVGSSPEILVKVAGGIVTIRPIAGTRPRGATAHEDKALEAELLADPKERAEHLMLLDLGRNDVGRVAQIGTVKVTDQFFVERYSQVMHIVSNVEGALTDQHDALDALAAGFPAGTVSGAPKVRAMEIIDELEKEKRGVYAGCVGYFSAAGEMDTCIVLRTALIKDGVMYVQAGAGIVADSDPKSEQQECINKARALFRAAEEAKRFASAARRGQ